MNNEQNMIRNSNQTTQAAAEQQAAVEQKLTKKKLTRRIFIAALVHSP